MSPSDLLEALYFPAAFQHEKPSSKQVKHAFTRLVSKLVTLKAQGKLAEKDFTEILSYVCSIYLESEIEGRFSKVLGKSVQLTIPFSDQ